MVLQNSKSKIRLKEIIECMVLHHRNFRFFSRLFTILTHVWARARLGPDLIGLFTTLPQNPA